MDKIDLDELERLAAQATPGPWRMVDARAFVDDEDFEIRNGQHCISYGTSEADASYIVAACNAEPELIARVRELERQRDWLAKALTHFCITMQGTCPIFFNCVVGKHGGTCGKTEPEAWIQAAKEAGE